MPECDWSISKIKFANYTSRCIIVYHSTWCSTSALKNWSSLTHQPEKSFQAQHSFLSFTVTILQGMGAEWDLSVLEQATVCLLAVEAQLGPTTWEQSYSIIWYSVWIQELMDVLYSRCCCLLRKTFCIVYNCKFNLICDEDNCLILNFKGKKSYRLASIHYYCYMGFFFQAKN